MMTFHIDLYLRNTARYTASNSVHSLEIVIRFFTISNGNGDNSVENDTLRSWATDGDLYK